MTNKIKRDVINLGNEDFNRKLFIYYEWLIPISIFIFSCIFLCVGAYLTGSLLLLLSIFLLPLIEFRKNLSKTIRAIIIIGFIVFAFLSLELYL